MIRHCVLAGTVLLLAAALAGGGASMPVSPPDDIAWSVELLHLAQNAGRKVLVVEYLKDREKMAAAASRIREEGFLPYFAPRRLHCLNPPAIPDATGRLPEHPCR
jgi:endo-alpha-1,4-polygalactosaminidase (GH114 family)